MARRILEGRARAGALALALGALLPGCAREADEDGTESAPRRPDVVLISLDTLRADHLGCYGYERATSPSIDALAAGATLFERCYSTAPWTLVSHMSLLTGLYPGQHRVVTERTALSPDNPTLAERFSAAGYQTAAFHAPAWIEERYGFDRGFDVFVEHGNAEQASRHIAEYLAQRDADAPLFLFIHLFDVHSAPMGETDRLVYRPPAAYRELFTSDPEALFEEGDAHRLWYSGDKPTPPQVEALVGLYDGGIRYVDDVVGRWIENWQAEGWYDDALVVLTSDHGETLARRQGFLRAHGGLYTDGLHIPLILKAPSGVGAGQRVARPVNQVDIAPTLLAMAGLEVDSFLPGSHLLGPGPEPGHVMEARWNTDFAYVQWPLKVVQSQEDFRPQFLSDLEQDFAEERPVAREADPENHAQVLARLRAEFNAQIGALPLPDRKAAQVTEEMDEAELRQMEELGYGGRSKAGTTQDEPPEPPGSGNPQPPGSGNPQPPGSGNKD